jgi:hypothetical protein
MAYYTVNMTTQSLATKICFVEKPREYYCWFATLTAQGTWGGATLAWYVSFDQGVTLIPIKDLTDTAVSFTSNASVNVQLGVSHQNNTQPQIWAEMTGGTNSNLTVSVFDNRG